MGEEDAFQLLYEGHYRAVKNYLYSLTKNMAEAEDLTQEAFLRYEKKRVSFRGECSEYTMICQIGKNLWKNSLRKMKRLEPMEENASDSRQQPFEEQLADREMVLNIHKILHTMPEPYREVFTLRVFGELTFKQIAEVFAKSESWAKMTYYRGKSMIVERLEDGK
jgi:RNA polymerase sigma-70 factor (ECF subfamily)